MLPSQDPPTLVDQARRLARARPDARAYTWLRDGEVEERCLTFAGLDAGARAVAEELTQRGLAGERALLVYTPGLEFVRAFLGCLYAGVAAVPVSPPHGERGAPALLALARHAAPGIVLTDGALFGTLRPARELLGGVEVLATDSVPDAAGYAHRPRAIDPASLAFVQYTSGSTGTPRGVEVTHANLVRNEQMVRAAFGHDARTVFAGWLPLFHDMGLVGNVLQPLFLGVHAVLMAPAAFVQKPVRWLRAITRYGATTSGSPDFGYDLCARKVGDADLAGLDLSSWKVAFDGSEPVRADTLERFAARFARVGFDRHALYPCYGLAEASLFVTGNGAGEAFTTLRVDREALAAGRAEPAAAGHDGDAARRTLVGCGRPWLDQELCVVDPATRTPLGAGAVGELWIRGGNVARGYRGLAEGAEDPFRARLADGDGPWLRTGDLGFLHAGQLFVTGRLKDVVVQRGKNHDPQDLEAAAGEGHPALRPGHAAAFAADEEDERLVVVHEVDRRHAGALAAGDAAADALRAELAGAVRAAVARRAGLQVWRVVLIPHGTLPRTSSGKVRRRACRALLARGELAELAGSPVRAP